MLVKFKKLHPNGVVPTVAKPGDAGADLTCVAFEEQDKNIIYHTGVAVEIPEGYFGLLMPRSSNVKKDLLLGNSLGLIDSGYRGELCFIYKKVAPVNRHYPGMLSIEDQYAVGDRVGQLVILPYPAITYVEATELSPSVRGTGGFGSSGR